MSVLAITCDNCGAKYRLPETFQGDKAKCQKCGSVIDVAAQRAAASAQTTPTPKPVAAPKPVSGPVRRESARPEREPRKTEEVPAKTRRARGAEAEAKSATDGKRPRSERKGGEERVPKKSNTMLLAGGGLAALAIVAVIVVLSTNKKESVASTPQAKAETPASAGANGEPAKPTADANGSSQPKEATPAVASKTEQEPKTPAAEPPKPNEPKPEEPAKSEAPKASEPAKTEPVANEGGVKQRWELNKTTNLADVYDPKVLGELTWSAEVTAEEQAEIRSLVEDVCNGGRAGITAKPKLEKAGYPALFGLVERLRQLDYKSGDEQMTAWELNKILETILVTLNTGFAAVEAGSDLDPRKADHNARTNEAWARLLGRWATRAEFDTWRKEKLAENKKK